MIRVSKGAKPPVLVRSESGWTDEYRRLRDGDDSVPAAAATRYRHPDIKAAVMRDSHDKCIYCESRPSAVDWGHVEHMMPKSAFPHLVVDWNNLGFVCGRCNVAKGDYHDERARLVDPFREEPADFFWFAGPLMLGAPGNDRGRVSVRKLGLDRAELIERRVDHLRRLEGLLDSWARLDEGPAKEFAAEELARLAKDDGEYAAATRAFLAASPLADGLHVSPAP